MEIKEDGEDGIDGLGIEDEDDSDDEDEDEDERNLKILDHWIPISCRHHLRPKTHKRTVTGRSWDYRILAVLLPAQSFLLILLRRSGISKLLFSWMRSCFQIGDGGKRFFGRTSCTTSPLITVSRVSTWTDKKIKLVSAV